MLGMAKRSRLRRVARWFFGGLAFLVLGVVVAGFVLNEPRPTGGVNEAGAGDSIARRIEAAIGQEAWGQTGAVAWTFNDSLQHLWDRERDFSRVRWDDYEVLLRGDASGVAFQNGARLRGDDAREALDHAHGRFINDSYWLNPFSKFFDPGVTRSVIETERGDALLMEFSSGGRTPGDAYVITTDESGRPTYWQMWVSIIPVGGVGCSWDDWVELSTGAMVATKHEFGMASLELSDVRGAETLAALVGEEDPFAALETP